MSSPESTVITAIAVLFWCLEMKLGASGKNPLFVSGIDHLHREIIKGAQNRQRIAVAAAKPDICVDDGEARICPAVDGQLVDTRDDVHIACIIHVVQIRYNQAPVQVDIERFTDGGGVVETQMCDL